MTADKKKPIHFNTIWIRFDDTSSDKHQLFIKEHRIRNQEPEYPKGKTLFVLNVPPYATVDALKNAFTTACGPVKSITFIKNKQHTDKGFKSGYIVFAKESAITKALSLSTDYTLLLSTNKAPVLTGMAKWCQNYNNSIPNEAAIKKSIEEYMNKYDKMEEKRLKEEKSASETVDDEGWTTVTGRKKRGEFAVARKESTIQKIHFKEEERKRKKQLMNFYTFQIRESKKQNLADLRKKFELDKQKLEQIKSKRRFKPF